MGEGRKQICSHTFFNLESISTFDAHVKRTFFGPNGGHCRRLETFSLTLSFASTLSFSFTFSFSFPFTFSISFPLSWPFALPTPDRKLAHNIQSPPIT
jgi:hypothetical protein